MCPPSACALRVCDVVVLALSARLQWAIELVKEHAEARRGDVPADEYVAKFVMVKDPNKCVAACAWRLHPRLCAAALASRARVCVEGLR